MPSQTPNQRLRDIGLNIEYARQKLTENLQYEQQKAYLATLLAGYAMSQAHPAEIATERAVNASWDRYYRWFLARAEGFAGNVTPEHLRRLTQMKDGGKKLTEAFATYYASAPRYAEDAPPTALSTGRNRIQRLKLRMQSGNYTTPEQKRALLAELAAARKSIYSQDDYTNDSRLRTQLDQGVIRMAADYRKQLENAPAEELDRMFRLAQNDYLGERAMRAIDEYIESQISPAQKEIRRIQSEEAQAANASPFACGARILWLALHPEISAQELETGDWLQQARALEESPAYQRFSQSRSKAEMLRLISDLDLRQPESAKPLLDAWESLKKDQEVFDAEYDPLLQMLEQDRSSGGRLINQVMALQPTLNAGPDAPAEQKNAYKAINELCGELAAEEWNRDDVKDRIFQLRAHLTRYQASPDFSDDPAEAEKLRPLFAAFQIPPRGTVEENELHMAAIALTERNLIGYKAVFFRKIAMYELYQNAADWRKVPYDKDALRIRAGQLTNEAMDQGLGEVVDDLSNERQKYSMLCPGNGKACVDTLNRLRRELEAEAGRRQAQSAEDRLEELLSFPEQRRWIEGAVMDEEELYSAATSVIAGHLMAKEAREHPERFRTKQAVNQRWRQHLQAVQGSLDDIAVTTFKLRCGQAMLDPSGKELISLYKQMVLSSTAIRPDLDPSMYPTARAQIKQLQIDSPKLLNGRRRIDYLEERCLTIGQILAARELLGVVPGVSGGDKKLDKPMTSEMFVLAREYGNIVEGLSDEEQDRLFAKITSPGHGGALEADFRKLMREKNSRLENLPQNLRPVLRPSARERIEGMQEKLKQTQDPAEKKKYLVRIIAARTAVDARRGGMFGADARLEQQLDPAVYAQHVELAGQKLASLDENAVAGLLRQAEAGHGGEMLKEFQRQERLAAQQAPAANQQQEAANQQPEAVNQQPAPVHHAAPAAEQNGPHLG